MAIKTTIEQIEEVQTAITETLKAQQMGMGDKLLLKARLRDLTDRESMLLARYKSESASGGISFNTGIIYR